MFEHDFAALIAGDLNDAEAEAFLRSTGARLPSAGDLVAACRILRKVSIDIHIPAGAIDVCGTGGDAKGTLNISTAVAFVAAAAGVPVAKHGNRAASSYSGATDVLDALGIATDLAPCAAERQFRANNIAFLAAARYHPVLAGLAPLRRRIGHRTIFNLLGPLLNPGHVRRQLTGVYAAEAAIVLAEALGELGCERAWVVNGDGLDEITMTGVTHVVGLHDGAITEFTIDPGDHGIPLAPLSAIRGGTPAENAAALVHLFEGSAGAYRDIVCLNAAAALQIAERVDTFADGLVLSRQMLDSGAALALLRTLQKDFPA